MYIQSFTCDQRGCSQCQEQAASFPLSLGSLLSPSCEHCGFFYSALPLIWKSAPQMTTSYSLTLFSIFSRFNSLSWIATWMKSFQIVIFYSWGLVSNLLFLLKVIEHLWQILRDSLRLSNGLLQTTQCCKSNMIDIWQSCYTFPSSWAWSSAWGRAPPTPCCQLQPFLSPKHWASAQSVLDNSSPSNSTAFASPASHQSFP